MKAIFSLFAVLVIIFAVLFGCQALLGWAGVGWLVALVVGGVILIYFWAGILLLSGLIFLAYLAITYCGTVGLYLTIAMGVVLFFVGLLYVASQD